MLVRLLSLNSGYYRRVMSQIRDREPSVNYRTSDTFTAKPLRAVRDYPYSRLISIGNCDDALEARGGITLDLASGPLQFDNGAGVE
jgi:hypothetical protein